jgi:GT2 family glycosyltransferase
VINVRKIFDVLIICTKDRPVQLESRLIELSHFAVLPNTILIVDSSKTTETELVVNNSFKRFTTEIRYIRTKPGLPFQRNCGIRWVFENYMGTQIVHFLDDDIIPSTNYFSTLLRLFEMNPDAIAIGGYDKNLDAKIHSSPYRRILGLGSSQSGVILKSGIAIPPAPKAEIHASEWLVGGMQSIRAEVFQHHIFDSSLRMYGEDIDFYLRISSLGKIICSKNLPIIHLNDPTNRDSIRKLNLYHNGMRWHLATKYPQSVNRRRVVAAAFILAFGELGRSILRGNKNNFLASIGNFEFILKLLTNQQVVQLS